MDRRTFVKTAGLGALALAAEGTMPLAARKWNKSDKILFGSRPTGHFSLLQLSSVTDTIGNSYILVTKGGKVIVIDGGFETEQDNLRSRLAQLGNHVDLWFITHPHQDHMGAFAEILSDRRGISIDKVIFSRVSDAILDGEPQNAADARRYYKAIESITDPTDVIDLHTIGGRFDIDGIGIMVLGVANPELTMNPYNNQSMILRFWDDTKSVVILGDAGIECGNKALERYPAHLDCDYLQMAHHGQNGCDEHFYKSIHFRACLWPTPSWVWEPAPQHAHLKTRDTRRWMDEIGITEHHPSCVEKDWQLI